MANTITNTTIVKGRDLVVNQILIDSDGTEETDLVVYDSSAVATLLGKTDPLKCRLMRAQFVFQNAATVATLTFEYDANTDVIALPVSMAVLANGGFTDMDFNDCGGIENLANAAAGATGDILLTTTNLDSADRILLNLFVRPY